MRDSPWIAAAGVALLLVACTSAQPLATSPEKIPESIAPAPSEIPPATPGASLLRDLEPRPGRPGLVGGEAAACIPLCGQGRVAGGALPAGRYQTEWFFGGTMTLETDGTWERTEDSNGELSLPIAAAKDLPVYRLAFFLDPALVVDDMPQEVQRTATAYVGWLAAHDELVTSKPTETRVGSVPALTIDVALASDAEAQYPDCRPEACVTFLKVAAFDHSDGILGDDVYRFLFADITYSDTHHLLVVKVEGRDEADLRAVLPRVDAILETVTVPARPGHG